MMKEMHPDIIELLVLRATEGLTDEQASTLAGLLNEHGLEDSDELDLAAAAAANAFALRDVQEAEDAPAELKDRLKADADQFFGRHDTVVELRPAANDSAWNPGWAVAATLAVVLLVTSLVDFGSEPSLEQQRQALIAEEGSEQVAWATSEFEPYKQVTGGVVWNDAKQEGYMLLTGMPENDPALSQYQLWVVDSKRDVNPVDGGVFDIPAGQETVIIPIDAKLAVNKPAAFAITREKPGGVVVSAGPLLVVAAAG